MKVVITGATGYIGTRLTALASRRGYDVIAASRQQPTSSNLTWLNFDLASDEAAVLPASTDVVIHLAANTLATNVSYDVGEVAAARRLLKSAQDAGARFIFVSSQTARVDAPSVYGQIKWRIEQDVLAAGGWVVRPGQVYGGEFRGLYGLVVNTVKKFPLLPAFMPVPRVQPVHVDDLAEGLLRIAERNDVPSGVYSLASPEPVLFSNFLREIARSRLRCKRIFVPVPILIINFCAAVIGSTWRARLGLDRLRSLFALPVMKTASDLKLIGLTLRPLTVGLHPAGDNRRRCLLREGKSLLAYVLKEQPSSAVLRRYIRVIERLRGGEEFGLPEIFLNKPILLSLLDKGSWSDASVGEEFFWRLDTATMLAEASPSGIDRFLETGRKYGLLRSLLSMTNALASEAFWRLARVLVSPMLRLSMARSKSIS